MIACRPVAPLTPGRSGLVSALTTMALTAPVPGTSCQGLKDASATPAATAKTAGNAYPVAIGRKQP
jgi:hypothetical protein